MSDDRWFNSIPDEISRIIFRLKLNLPNGTLEKDFRTDVDVDYDLLEEQLESTPQMMAFYSGLLAEQGFITDRIERQLKRRRGKVVEKIWEDARSSSIRLTNDIVKEMVEADDGVMKLDAQLMMEKRTQSKLIGVVQSLRMKSDHLRSLSGFKRQERENP